VQPSSILPETNRNIHQKKHKIRRSYILPTRQKAVTSRKEAKGRKSTNPLPAHLTVPGDSVQLVQGPGCGRPVNG